MMLASKKSVVFTEKRVENRMSRSDGFMAEKHTNTSIKQMYLGCDLAKYFFRHFVFVSFSKQNINTV